MIIPNSLAKNLGFPPYNNSAPRSEYRGTVGRGPSRFKLAKSVSVQSNLTGVFIKLMEILSMKIDLRLAARLTYPSPHERR